FFEIFAAVGGGVVIGLMTFGFFGRMAGLVMGMIAALVLVFFTVGFLREYTVLLSSLTAYGASTIICTLMTLRSKAPDFDFDSIDKSVIAFHKEAQA
ncbi:MAG TPA: sodium:proline symporter, partial [Thiopseudomonas sp.]|nr:sodium:proline symporter [Thiopseudomonas sp.]